VACDTKIDPINKKEYMDRLEKVFEAFPAEERPGFVFVVTIGKCHADPTRFHVRHTFGATDWADPEHPVQLHQALTGISEAMQELVEAVQRGSSIVKTNIPAIV
jgi:hypothetical protein